MKIKTRDLSGVALDWAVATCEGFPIRHDPMNFGRAFAEGGFWIWDDSGPISKRDYRLIGRQYCPSTNWAIGGPIIEREKLSVELKQHGYWMASCQYNYADEKEFLTLGDTPLIAAMRCYVASKLGYEVEIPDALVR